MGQIHIYWLSGAPLYAKAALKIFLHNTYSSSSRIDSQAYLDAVAKMLNSNDLCATPSMQILCIRPSDSLHYAELPVYASA